MAMSRPHSVAQRAANEWRVRNGLSPLFPGLLGVDIEYAVVEALSAAGLFITPLHERALEACKQVVAGGTFLSGDAHTAVYAVGREALAAEKPKERWKATPGVTGYGVEDTQRGLWFVMPSQRHADRGAAELNRVDREQQK
jgi:hypothetical protein